MEGRRGEVGLVWLGAHGPLDPQIRKFRAKIDRGFADLCLKQLASWPRGPIGLGGSLEWWI